MGIAVMRAAAIAHVDYSAIPRIERTAGAWGDHRNRQTFYGETRPLTPQYRVCVAKLTTVDNIQCHCNKQRVLC